jgi:hypothetical protein
MDSSESITESDWVRFKEFTNKLVSGLPIRKDSMHLGVIEFNTDAKLVTSLESNKGDLESKLESGLSKSTKGRTFTGKAIRLAVDMLKKNARGGDIPKILILLTDGLPSDREAADAAFAEAKAAGVAVQIVTIGFMVNVLPLSEHWSAEGFPPIRMTMGYAQLLARIKSIEGAICKLSMVTLAPTTAAPTPPTGAPQKPCNTSGHLHMDFGGDVASFGDAQEKELMTKLEAALGLAPGKIEVTRHTDTDKIDRNLGALGHGKIFHPTKVQLNFKFNGTQAIEHGYKLEKDVEKGLFQPLPDFPLLRLEMEEVYCTSAPSVAPSMPPTEWPTGKPTESPSKVPTESPTNVPTRTPTLTPTESPTTLTPTTTDEPSSLPTHTPTEHPTQDPTSVPTDYPTIEPTETPTETPTELPTFVPTAGPTDQPTVLPTPHPTEVPTGCWVRWATMHLIFRNASNQQTNSAHPAGKPGVTAGAHTPGGAPRRLLVAPFPIQHAPTGPIGWGERKVSAAPTGWGLQEAKLLQAAVMAELKLDPTGLDAMKTYEEDGGYLHVEIPYVGLDSLKLGREFERKVLHENFNPVPGFPIRRIWLDTVFACNTGSPSGPSYSPKEAPLDLITAAPKLKSSTTPKHVVPVLQPSIILPVPSVPKTASPSMAPTEIPTTISPTDEPTEMPTTPAPTDEPTEMPTAAPTHQPTHTPTEASPSAACQSTGDPHNVDFFGSTWELHSPGVYQALAYRNLVVQQVVEKCTGKKSHFGCNTEVAVKAADKVLSLQKDASGIKISVDGETLSGKIRKETRTWSNKASVTFHGTTAGGGKINAELVTPEFHIYLRADNRTLSYTIKAKVNVMGQAPGLCGGGGQAQLTPIGNAGKLPCNNCVAYTAPWAGQGSGRRENSLGSCTCAEWVVPNKAPITLLQGRSQPHTAIVSNYVEFQPGTILQAFSPSMLESEPYKAALKDCTAALKVLQVQETDEIIQKANDCAMDVAVGMEEKRTLAEWEEAFCQSVETAVDPRNPSHMQCKTVAMCAANNRLDSQGSGKTACHDVFPDLMSMKIHTFPPFKPAGRPQDKTVHLVHPVLPALLGSMTNPPSRPATTLVPPVRPELMTVQTSAPVTVVHLAHLKPAGKPMLHTFAPINVAKRPEDKVVHLVHPKSATVTLAELAQ